MKKFKGKVVSLKNKKTAIVLVERKKIHPIYRKAIKMTKRYQVHDEIGVKVGSLVIIGECRPISKTKSWKVVKVVE